MKKKKKTYSLIHLNRKKETRSLSDAFRLAAQRRNEVRQGSPSNAPIRCSIFEELRPMGNSMAIAAQRVFEQLHRGRTSERVNVPGTEKWTDTHKPTQMDPHFINWLGHQIYAPFPGRKTLLVHRHSSPGFHSPIWCLAKASVVVVC